MRNKLIFIFLNYVSLMWFIIEESPPSPIISRSVDCGDQWHVLSNLSGRPTHPPTHPHRCHNGNRISLTYWCWAGSRAPATSPGGPGSLTSPPHQLLLHHTHHTGSPHMWACGPPYYTRMPVLLLLISVVWLKGEAVCVQAASTQPPDPPR